MAMNFKLLTSTGICLKQEIPNTVLFGSVKLGRWKYTVSSSKLWDPSGSANVGKYFHPGGHSVRSDSSGTNGGYEYST